MLRDRLQREQRAASRPEGSEDGMVGGRGRTVVDGGASEKWVAVRARRVEIPGERGETGRKVAK
jgi:hypothetical protein